VVQGVVSPGEKRREAGLRTALLVVASVLVALVGAPRVYAADDAPAPNGGTAQAQPAPAPASDTTATPPSSSQTADQPAAGASTTPNAPDGPSQDGPPSNASNGQSTPNASSGPSQDGPPSTAAAPNTADSSTQAAGQGASAGGGTEQSTSVAQAANADAAAHQQDVGNSQTTVKVDEPGNGGPVSQENQAAAGAEATAAAETSAPSTSDQSAAAGAAATQTDTQNTAVTVRVGSPGDDGSVEQANAAGATATAAVTTPETGESTVDESAAAVATQDGVANTNVSVRVFSPGNDGAVTQTNTAAAAADTSGGDGATAEATQTGVQNTNVSIRVESPGTSGPVAQQSTASTDTGAAVSATANGVDTNLTVVVDGTGLQQPGVNGLQVWEWTWNWDRDESATADALLDTPPASWDWLWGSGNNGSNGPGLGQVTSQAVGNAGLAAGTWTWNWSWARAGVPNWTWDWDWEAQNPCASCVWIWNWTWNWTGQPAPTGSTPPPAQPSDDPGTSGQANIAVADARAGVTAVVTQTTAQDGEGTGTQYAGQVVTVEQSADATATATQLDVETVATANHLGAQVNRVVSDASATAGGRVEQRANQTMLVDVDGEGAATQWSGQEIDLVQEAQADVHVVQRNVSLRTRDTVAATAQASAAVAADVDQNVVQDALVDGGTTDQWAGQLTLVEQLADAASVVEQTGAAELRSAGRTARAQSSAAALAQNGQGVVQRAARGGGLASQTAMQVAYVGQDGSATATTTQQVGGAASRLASSDANATNRALVVQKGVQESSGALGLDIQDLTQESIVVQTAAAVSVSAGGVAGKAVVANSAIVQQTAGQSLAGGPGSPGGQDLSAFCAPPALASSGEGEPASSAVSGSHAVVAGDTVVLLDDGDDVQLFHSSFHQRFSAAARRTRAITPRFPAVRTGIDAGRPAAGSSPASLQISVPRPTQARLDTRPEVHAGAGDAGREPPLPPAGDPPLWVSALTAATAGGAGSSGIAAILLAFALVPPMLRRAREGSVVRRPIDVLSQVDVPV
jgi:hypothetical protein